MLNKWSLKTIKKMSIVDRKPTIGDVVLLCDDKGKPTHNGGNEGSKLLKPGKKLQMNDSY